MLKTLGLDGDLDSVELCDLLAWQARIELGTDGDAVADVAFSFTFSPLTDGRQTATAYYATASDYNRAQFRLFRALGYPAQGLACSDSFGAVMPPE